MQVETTKADIHSTTILQTQTDFQQITLEVAFNTASVTCHLTINEEYDWDVASRCAKKPGYKTRTTIQDTTVHKTVITEMLDYTYTHNYTHTHKHLTFAYTYT
jgi:hypothetical protein